MTMAATRHSLSEHALQLISFQATHADRMAKAMREPKLEPGDAVFLENVFVFVRMRHF